MSDEMTSVRSRISSNDERKSVSAAEPGPASRVRGAGAWLLHELYEILPPVIFFELRRIFLTLRSSELQLNRQQRLRELFQLSRLADAHSDQEFRDPTSVAHRQLVEIVRRLTREPRARPLLE